jgi:hypothetical protein
MKIYSIGEYKVIKIRGKQITDLYEVRLAIWKACKEFRQKTGTFPTHIGFPSGSEERLATVTEFVQRYQAKLITELYIPYSEIWIGTAKADALVGKPLEWTRKPSETYEEIRHIHRGRKRVKTLRPAIPEGHPLRSVSSKGKSFHKFQ